MISIIDGNILDAKEEYILQQCCCTAIRPHGLSETIANKWKDANIYALRKGIGKRNMAIPEDRPEPGTIQIIGKGKIICAFAQVAMGKPGMYDSCGKPDSLEDRYNYFIECLNKITKLNITSIAIPYKIGCGLAGGNWERYYNALNTWTNNNPTLKIAIYKL